MTEILIPLADIPRHLKKSHGISVSYRRVYNMVLDGEIDAAKDPTSGRWLIPETELNAISNLAIRPLQTDPKMEG